MKHPTLIRAAALSFLAIFTFICGEIGLRIVNAYYPQPFFYSENLFRFRAEPFQKLYGFSTNSQGFNDIEHNREKPQNTFRIVSIGDSFAFGVVPYEFNYNTILNRLLKDSGYNVEIVNMGISGAAPRNYYSLLETEGSAFQPDLVMISFFIGNDFEAVDPVRSWHSYSFMASLVKYLSDVASKTNFNPGTVSDTYDDTGASFTDEEYDDLETKRSWVFRKNNPLYLQMYGKTIDDIRRIRDFCKKLNFRLLIAIIPDELQVNSSLAKRALALSHSDESEYDFEQPNKMLAASLSDLGIAYIDFLPALRQRSGAAAMYKPNDSHWNKKGNAVAAEELAEFLRDKPAILGR